MATVVDAELARISRRVRRLREEAGLTLQQLIQFRAAMHGRVALASDQLRP